jgi:hypothetical protein
MFRGRFRVDPSRTPRLAHARGRAMVIASINGVPGQGFAEVVEKSEGCEHRAGLLKMAFPNAARIQDLLDRSARLTYRGPVFVNGRWCAEAFPILVTGFVAEEGVSATIHIAQSDHAPMVRGSTVIVIHEIRSHE